MSSNTKILALCRAGIVRSGALSMTLKLRFGYRDAMQAGVDFTSPETLEMLYQWADKIYYVQDVFLERIPEQHRPKAELVDIGEDIWGNCMAPDLQSKVLTLLQNKGI